MKLERIQAATLTLDHGDPVTLTRIGRGRYCTAWQNGGGLVFLQVHEEDHAKELLVNLSGRPHLPEISYLGETEAGGVTYRWYLEPLYGKLTAAHTKAWRDYRHLQQLRRDAWRTEQHSTPWDQRHLIQGNRVNDRFEELVRGTPPLAPEWGETIESLVTWCGTYGAGWVIEELQVRNCGVDRKGELVLIDPVFDMELLVRKREEQRKKRTAWPL